MLWDPNLYWNLCLDDFCEPVNSAVEPTFFQQTHKRRLKTQAKHTLSMRLDCVFGRAAFAFSFLFFLLFFWETHFTWEYVCQWVPCTVHGTYYLFERPNFSLECDCSVGPVHCSWDPQTSFFNKTFIKNESHDTIHTFKNYFTIIFSIFSF